MSAPAATQPVVYDSSRLFMVISRDFTVDRSDQVSEAWNRFAMSVRVVGRFALACPLPSKGARKLATAARAASARAKS